jgi:hypothetical protein
MLRTHVHRSVQLSLSHGFAFDIGAQSSGTLAKLLILLAAAGVISIILFAHIA